MSSVQIPKAFQELNQPARYKVFYGGRGSGKSWAIARSLLLRAAQRKTRVLCTRELQSSIQESVHRLLSDQISALGLSPVFEIQQTTIRGTNGSEFIFEGVRSNVDKIKSMEGIDICWVEEADKVREASWSILIPTIRQEGSEIWVSFNPYLKSDATWQRFVAHQPPGAIVRKVSYKDNPWFPPELQAELDHLKEVNYEEYLHVWEGEFKSFAEGAVYGKQLREARESGRIRPHLPIQKATEVHTTWDLGKSKASMAVWFFQQVGPERRFIDYDEGGFMEIDEWAMRVKAKGYNLGKHFMPHDVEMDLLGNGGRSRQQQFEDAGIKPIVVVDRIRHLNEGIEMVRSQFPSYWFDSEKCERGLECLQNYRYEYDDKRRLDWRPEPLHDWASHAADAFRQQAQADRGQSKWVGVIKPSEPTRRDRHNPWHNQRAGWMT